MRYFQWLLGAVLITSLAGVATAISQFDGNQILHAVSALPSSFAVLGLSICVCYSQQLEDEGLREGQRGVYAAGALRKCRPAGGLPTISEERLRA